MANVDDMTGYLEAMKPTNNQGGELAQLQTLAEQQADADAEVKRLTSELAKATVRFNDLAERQVPELMDSIGIQEFKTTSGLFISIKETIRAAIPESQRPAAFKWLRDNGHASLIQRVVAVSFGRGEDDKANDLVEDLQVTKGLEPTDKTTVNANTLSAFVREQLRAGKDLPQDLLGVHRQRVAKIEV